eukprot:6283862-Karenia_brevis.AAC.1
MMVNTHTSQLSALEKDENKYIVIAPYMYDDPMWFDAEYKQLTAHAKFHAMISSGDVSRAVDHELQKIMLGVFQSSKARNMVAEIQNVCSQEGLGLNI